VDTGYSMLDEALSPLVRRSLGPVKTNIDMLIANAFGGPQYHPGAFPLGRPAA
jgi:hypothetical protein